MVYLQLLSEAKSRTNACARPDGQVADRWHSVLYIPGLLTPATWRKSQQVGGRGGVWRCAWGLAACSRSWAAEPPNKLGVHATCEHLIQRAALLPRLPRRPRSGRR